jgi:hypothetical protein
MCPGVSKNPLAKGLFLSPLCNDKGLLHPEPQRVSVLSMPPSGFNYCRYHVSLDQSPLGEMVLGYLVGLEKTINILFFIDILTNLYHYELQDIAL